MLMFIDIIIIVLMLMFIDIIIIVLMLMFIDIIIIVLMFECIFVSCLNVGLTVNKQCYY